MGIFPKSKFDRWGNKPVEFIGRSIKMSYEFFYGNAVGNIIRKRIRKPKSKTPAEAGVLDFGGEGGIRTRG
jgi:hypothetical protein